LGGSGAAGSVTAGLGAGVRSRHALDFRRPRLRCLLARALGLRLQLLRAGCHIVLRRGGATGGASSIMAISSLAGAMIPQKLLGCRAVSFQDWIGGERSVFIFIRVSAMILVDSIAP
jgi:hypothetical protein